MFTSSFVITAIISAGIIIIAVNIRVINSSGGITMEFYTCVVTIINNWGMFTSRFRLTTIISASIIIIAVYNGGGTAVIWVTIIGITFISRILAAVRVISFITSFFR
jgi:hypothetical protein